MKTCIRDIYDIPSFKKQEDGENFKTIVTSINKISLSKFKITKHPGKHANDIQ